MGHDWSKCQELKYLGCVSDESSTDVAKCDMKVEWEAKWQVPLGPWLMLGVCSLSV